MTTPIRLTVQRTAPGSAFGHCLVEVDDPELLGHEAELTLTLRVEVLDSRPVHGERELFQKTFQLDRPRTEIRLPADALRCYTYQGSEIELEVHAALKVDDSLLFDTKVSQEQTLTVPDRPALRTDAEELIEPDDAFDFLENFQAIPAKSRGIVAVLAAVAFVLIAVNTLLGVHDQFSPEGQTYFYSHRDGDGDSQSPLFNSLAGSGVAGALVWAAMRRQLRKYMTFALTFEGPINRFSVVPAGSLVRGVARCPLDDVTVRVVAANREKGQYRRGSGSNVRTVSFSKPVRAVKLYEQHIRHLPAGMPIESHLDGEVRFEPMFAALYPPLETDPSHGMDVVWEVQLLHPDFVDQELSGDTGSLRYEDFLEA